MPLPSAGYAVGSPFVELQSVDSTNNYALAQIHANLAQPGTCFFAHEQTSGKGQRGKTWATERGKNITLSIVLQPNFLEVFRQFWLSSCVAVATHQFLSKYGGKGVKIKWPNDLYCYDGKIAGILIENILHPSRSGTGSWDWAVIGIGVNINQTRFSEDLKNPVSLKQVTGHDYDTVQLAKELCSSVEVFYKRLHDGDVDSIVAYYNTQLYRKGQKVRFKRGNRIFEAMVKGVNDTGQLTVKNALEETFDFGQVEWML